MEPRTYDRAAEDLGADARAVLAESKEAAAAEAHGDAS